MIRIQNEKLAEFCATQPERFVGLASVALQHPDLAAAQLEEAAKRYNLRGALIGGSVEGEELASPRLHPFWAKAEELGVVIFIHPQGTAELESRLKGNGMLSEVYVTAFEHFFEITKLDRPPAFADSAASRAISSSRERS